MRKHLRDNSLSLFFLTIFLATVWFVQRGSAESKPVGELHEVTGSSE